MNKSSYICGLVFLLWAMTAVAVEKKDKPVTAEPPKKVEQKAITRTPAKIPTNPKAIDSSKRTVPATSAAKKFDDFIDKNHNGVDDRKENLVRKDDKKITK